MKQYVFNGCLHSSFYFLHPFSLPPPLLYYPAQCSPSKIIDSFSSVGRVSELVQYLHQLVYDDTSHTSLLKPKHVQNVLLKCFIHEVSVIISKSIQHLPLTQALFEFYS